MPPHIESYRLDDELMRRFLQASVGQISVTDGKFQGMETIKIEEDMTFQTEAEKKAFWDDWENGAD